MATFLIGFFMSSSQGAAISALRPPDNAVVDVQPLAIAGQVDEQLAALRSAKAKRRKLVATLLLSDVVAIAASLVIASLLRMGTAITFDALAIFASVLPVYVIVGWQTGAYSPSVWHRARKSVRSAGLAAFITAAVLFACLYAMQWGAYVSRLQLGLGLAFCAALGAAGRIFVARYSRKLLGRTPYADLCLYDGLPLHPDNNPGAVSATDVGLVPDLSQPQMVHRLGELVRGMDRIIVHCPEERQAAWSSALRCVDVRSEIVLPKLSHLNPLAVRYRQGEVSLVLANGPLRLNQQLNKRVFDLVVASCALVIAAPLMLVIAVLIRLDDGGDVFFRQDRIGLGNRTFKILKFRTMRSHQIDHLGVVSVTRNDQRVTRLGRFLRRTSLDELPQLINVLAGEMSIVGPRPHAPASRAEEQFFWVIDQRYWQRHSILPGITGLAQVRGLRGATERSSDVEQRLYADLEYVANWSLLNDLRIVVRTFRVLLHRNAF